MCVSTMVDASLLRIDRGPDTRSVSSKRVCVWRWGPGSSSRLGEKQEYSWLLFSTSLPSHMSGSCWLSCRKTTSVPPCREWYWSPVGLWQGSYGVYGSCMAAWAGTGARRDSGDHGSPLDLGPRMCRSLAQVTPLWRDSDDHPRPPPRRPPAPSAGSDVNWSVPPATSEHGRPGAERSEKGSGGCGRRWGKGRH